MEKISWTDHLKNEVLHKITKERSIVHTIKRNEANCICHILRRNWLLKYDVEGKIEARIEMLGRRGRMHKQLLDALKEMRGYWKLREETRDRSVWRSGFGRGYWSITRLRNDMRKLMQIIHSSDTAFIYTLCSRLYYNWHIVFNVHGSVHRKSMPIMVQQDATRYSLLYFCKLLFMFRMVTPPIIRSTYNCNYSIWHW
jgi:hypothetical protein